MSNVRTFVYKFQPSKESPDEKDMQTDDECTEVKSDTEKTEEVTDNRKEYELQKLPSLDEDSKVAEAANVPLPDDDEEKEKVECEETPGMSFLFCNIFTL